jgi:DNA-binding transcriptional LysR family regulator
MIDWEHYHSFLELMREGSFAGASRKIGVSHPTLRRRIDELEQKLGLVLFTRSLDGLAPTSAARKIRRQAEAMEDAAQVFLRTAAAEGGIAAGSVRLSCGEISALEILPTFITDLRSRHPGLSLDLQIDLGMARILRGRADIAFSVFRPTLKALSCRKVGTLKLGLFAHRRYIGVAGVPHTIADLRGHSLVGPETDPNDLDIINCHGLDLKFSDFAIRSNSHAAQLAAVKAGAGIGLIMAPVAARDPALIRVLPDIFDHMIEPWIITHEDLRHEPRIRIVFDALVEHIARFTSAPLIRKWEPLNAPSFPTAATTR